MPAKPVVLAPAGPVRGMVALTPATATQPCAEALYPAGHAVLEVPGAVVVERAGDDVDTMIGPIDVVVTGGGWVVEVDGGGAVVGGGPGCRRGRCPRSRPR